MPSARRLSSSSGGMSTSTISSALSNTRVRHRLAHPHPVIFRTTSFRLSRCWMLSVVQTSMPAASSSSMSCQRLGWRLPGTLVWAYSSTSSRLGPARQRRVEVELLQDLVAVDDRLARQDLEALEQRSVSWRPCVSTRPTTTSRPPALLAARGRQHRVGLADAGRRAEEYLETAAPLLAWREPAGRQGGSSARSRRACSPPAGCSSTAQARRARG